MTSELKTCPFCGAQREYIHIHDTALVSRFIEYYARCWQCAACGPLAETEAEAIAAWNKRVEGKDGK